MSKDKFSIFDWVQMISFEKKPWGSFTEKQQDVFNSYMCHKVISMHEPYIEVVNLAQRIPYPEKEKTYKFYCSILPKRKFYSRYIKRAKKKVNEELLKYLSDYLMCGLGEAEENTYILGKEGVEDILAKSGVNEIEIKKLLKEIL